MKTKKQYDKNDFIMTLLKGRTFIVLIILVVLFSVLSENFFSTSTLLMVAKHVALYGILAIGMTYVIITGGIDLSVGSVVGLAGMIGGYLIQNGLTVGGYTLYFSVPMVILIVILLGCVKRRCHNQAARRTLHSHAGHHVHLPRLCKHHLQRQDLLLAGRL